MSRLVFGWVAHMLDLRWAQVIIKAENVNVEVGSSYVEVMLRVIQEFPHTLIESTEGVVEHAADNNQRVRSMSQVGLGPSFLPQYAASRH